MPSTSSIDARFLGRTRTGQDPKKPRRPRPRVALVRGSADVGRESAGRASRRAFAAWGPSRLRQVLEISLVAVFCLCAAVALWQHQDDGGCGPKLYRDPVTGRVTSYGTPHESLRTQARCARPGLAGQKPAAARGE
jgi:hypothetical protein